MRKQELHPRTAAINKTQKNKSKKARIDALQWLAATFPNAFDNTLCIRPLKAGIMEDILQHTEKAMADGISKSKLREAVVLFTRRLDYLACLKAREMRIDLEGNLLCEVTEEEAAHAAAKIKKRVEKGIRNARKLAAETSPNHYTSSNHTPGNSSKLTSHTSSAPEDYLPIYPARAPVAYPAQQPSAQTARASAVVVKHKTSRQFDPSAVARLKEKLGLSRSSLEQKESVE